MFQVAMRIGGYYRVFRIVVMPWLDHGIHSETLAIAIRETEWIAGPARRNAGASLRRRQIKSGNDDI
jgi:hypothetical protein